MNSKIMLRNIPNKVDLVSHQFHDLRATMLTNQPLLKTIVDETSFGKYDFMYLRIGTSTQVCTSGKNKANHCRFCQQLQVRTSTSMMNVSMSSPVF
jgi:hypothetical protein